MATAFGGLAGGGAYHRGKADQAFASLRSSFSKWKAGKSTRAALDVAMNYGAFTAHVRDSDDPDIAMFVNADEMMDAVKKHYGKR